jgi:hypothetical protein
VRHTYRVSRLAATTAQFTVLAFLTTFAAFPFLWMSITTF